jgi:hypothetical protein
MGGVESTTVPFSVHLGKQPISAMISTSCSPKEKTAMMSLLTLTPVLPVKY